MCSKHTPFDCVNHAVLLEKVKFYGVSGKFYNLVKSYLAGRYQKVILSHNNGSNPPGRKYNRGYHRDQFWDPFFFF